MSRTPIDQQTEIQLLRCNCTVVWCLFLQKFVCREGRGFFFFLIFFFILLLLLLLLLILFLLFYLRFYIPLKKFHLYGDVTIAGKGLQNLGLCSALRAFEQGEIFIVPHLLWHGTSVFSGLIRRTAPISRLLRHTSWWGGSFRTRILTMIDEVEILNTTSASVLIYIEFFKKFKLIIYTYNRHFLSHLVKRDGKCHIDCAADRA
jgi:hypothetical protein